MLISSRWAWAKESGSEAAQVPGPGKRAAPGAPELQLSLSCQTLSLVLSRAPPPCLQREKIETLLPAKEPQRCLAHTSVVAACATEANMPDEPYQSSRIQV